MRDALLPQLIRRRAVEEPNRLCVQDVDGRSLTYAELHHETLRWAGAFRRLGVGAKDRVVTILPTSLESYSAWLGLSWLRAWEVPINPAYQGRMLEYVIRNAAPKVVVVAAEFVDRFKEVAGRLDSIRTLIIPDAESSDDSLPFRMVRAAEFFSGGPLEEPLEDPRPHDICCMIYTSGTTGPSKGVLVPWGQAYYSSHGMIADDMSNEGAYYTFGGTYHAGGKYALYRAVLRNIRLVLRKKFSRTHFWEDIREFNCTFAFLPVAIIRWLLSDPPRPDDVDNPLSDVMTCPVPPEIEDFKSRFGVRVRTHFGMTEIVPPIASPDWDVSNRETCGKIRPGPPGFEARVVDEHDYPVGPSVVGELILRTDEPWASNAGYWGMPEETARAWRNGWFHTGDGFRYDQHGFFYFVDRMKDCIRRRAENISSFEVEAYVTEHPEIVECAAIPAPSEYGEDEVKVCVVREAGSTLTPEQLLDYLAPRMPGFMLPRYIEFFDELPKTDSTGRGRVRKVELKADPLNERTWDRERSAAGTMIGEPASR